MNCPIAALVTMDTKALIVLGVAVVLPAAFFIYLFGSEAMSRRRLRRAIQERINAAEDQD